MKKPEVLLPAGNLETLKIAILYGADAVYIGGDAYSLRAKADNFSKEDLSEAIDFAHTHGKKVYITANIFAHNSDLEGIRCFFAELSKIRPDGVLVADPGVFLQAKELLGDIPIHISTQANNTNYESGRFWHRLGASRIVTARELSIAEIRMWKDHLPEDLEIETFVHGAMCISYSGRCLLSNYFTGRDANKGACTHPCRWRYVLMEETRDGEYLPIEESERGTFIMNSKDLCMIEHIPELVEAGVDSFKVEGRMKSVLYVATTARAYRQAVDDYFEDPEKYKTRLSWYRKEVQACTNRTFTTGFFFGKPDEESMIYDESTYVTNYVFLGIVEGEASINNTVCYRMMQRNKFAVGNEVEVMRRDGQNITVTVLHLYDREGNMLDSVPHAKQMFYIDVGCELFEYDIIRMKKEENG